VPAEFSKSKLDVALQCLQRVASSYDIISVSDEACMGN
jgi:hypothetical protein